MPGAGIKVSFPTRGNGNFCITREEVIFVSFDKTAQECAAIVSNRSEIFDPPESDDVSNLLFPYEEFFKHSISYASARFHVELPELAVCQCQLQEFAMSQFEHPLWRFLGSGSEAWADSFLHSFFF